jgi:hypothetical protein
MKLLVLAFAVAMSAPTKGEAAEAKAPEPLQLRPKAAVMAVPPVTHSYAPFVNPAFEHELDLVPRREDPRQEQSRSSCSGERSLCYDAGSGRIVYKPARQYMPELPGLQRENISLKRDRIIFRYSF